MLYKKNHVVISLEILFTIIFLFKIYSRIVFCNFFFKYSKELFSK